MNQLRHLTVVYSINDTKAFLEEHRRVMDMYHTLGNKPWAITAMSTDHEIRRVELIEEAIDQEDHELIVSLINHKDVGNIASLDQLEAETKTIRKRN